MESTTHSLVDAAMKTLPVMLPALDFSTVKNEIFPPIASTFSRTNSLNIKIRALEAFVVLCGGSIEKDVEPADDLTGIVEDKKKTKKSSPSILDKYTIQEKLVPLLKAIKTKEPGVMMAALEVFRQAGKLVDTEFIALELLPLLWAFSLGPLLNIKQFGQFMALIKSLSTKVEREQIRKLQELSSREDASVPRQATGVLGGTGPSGAEDTPTDFEQLVLGRKGANNTNGEGGWDHLTSESTAAKPLQPVTAPAFSWSSNVPQPASRTSTGGMSSVLASTGQNSRSITPDSGIGAFPSLEPNRQRASVSSAFGVLQPQPPQSQTSTISWNQTQQINRPALQPSFSSSPMVATSTSASITQSTPNYSSFSLPPPPATTQLTNQQRPSAAVQSNIWATTGTSTPAQATQPPGQQTQGLDKYASLL